MGHGKNKQKTQKVGLGQQPKETREQRRMRIEEEAKAREVRVVKRLTYYLGWISAGYDPASIEEDYFLHFMQNENSHKFRCSPHFTSFNDIQTQTVV